MTAQTKRTDDTKATNDAPDDRSGIGSTVADAADTIRSVATDAAERIPEVASATRSALVEVDRQVEAGSDEMLTVGHGTVVRPGRRPAPRGRQPGHGPVRVRPGGRPRPAAARSLEPVAHRAARDGRAQPSTDARRLIAGWPTATDWLEHPRPYGERTVAHPSDTLNRRRTLMDDSKKAYREAEVGFEGSLAPGPTATRAWPTRSATRATRSAGRPATLGDDIEPRRRPGRRRRQEVRSARPTATTAWPTRSATPATTSATP